MVDLSAKAGPWVIVVDAMSYEKANELGRTMGSMGVTGRFMRGTVADQIGELARLKSEAGCGKHLSG